MFCRKLKVVDTSPPALSPARAKLAAAIEAIPRCEADLERIEHHIAELREHLGAVEDAATRADATDASTVEELAEWMRDRTCERFSAPPSTQTAALMRDEAHSARLRADAAKLALPAIYEQRRDAESALNTAKFDLDQAVHAVVEAEIINPAIEAAQHFMSAANKSLMLVHRWLHANSSFSGVLGPKHTYAIRVALGELKIDPPPEFRGASGALTKPFHTFAHALLKDANAKLTLEDD